MMFPQKNPEINLASEFRKKELMYLVLSFEYFVLHAWILTV